MDNWDYPSPSHIRTLKYAASAVRPLFREQSKLPKTYHCFLRVGNEKTHTKRKGWEGGLDCLYMRKTQIIQIIHQANL